MRAALSRSGPLQQSDVERSSLIASARPWDIVLQGGRLGQKPIPPKPIHHLSRRYAHAVFDPGITQRSPHLNRGHSRLYFPGGGKDRPYTLDVALRRALPPKTNRALLRAFALAARGVAFFSFFLHSGPVSKPNLSSLRHRRGKARFLPSAWYGIYDSCRPWSRVFAEANASPQSRRRTVMTGSGIAFGCTAFTGCARRKKEKKGQAVGVGG